MEFVEWYYLEYLADMFAIYVVVMAPKQPCHVVFIDDLRVSCR
jgi:hypothetical protein